VLTIAYCRVSTEEQAADGFSIEGQAEKLKAYAELNDLGTVTVIADPGWSGKNLERPGLQQLLAMVEAGHVENVLTWRLDRLSRNLGDLILLADTFGAAGVALHSFTERIDLSSATGRMFYNILGSFAQFYREQLAENVRMGMQQAVREGKWVNRPKTGYDLVDGELVPNGDAPTIREIFRLRATGLSCQQIEDRTGVRYSTVREILLSRIYLGEVQLNGEWFPGRHEPIITAEEFEAAQRPHVPGRRRGSDLLSGRVFCGLCGRRMAIEYNGEARSMYRCRHRGNGCAQPRRSTKGLHRAALLGMRLLAEDEELQDAIRAELSGSSRRRGQKARRRDSGTPAEKLAELSERRRKLLELHYADRISADLFAEEERSLSRQIEAVREEASGQRAEEQSLDELAARFEQVAATLRQLDVDRVWAEATEEEKRVLVEELVEQLVVFPDHLEILVTGAPRLRIGLSEVGLGGGESQDCGVGGGT
jgi:site-specific DNA recombinase